MTVSRSTVLQVAQALGVAEPTLDEVVVAFESRLWPPLFTFVPMLLKYRLVVVRGQEALVLAAQPVSLRPRELLWSGRRADIEVQREGPMHVRVRLGDRSLWIQRKSAAFLTS